MLPSVCFSQGFRGSSAARKVVDFTLTQKHVQGLKVLDTYNKYLLRARWRAALLICYLAPWTSVTAMKVEGRTFIVSGG